MTAYRIVIDGDMQREIILWGSFLSGEGVRWGLGTSHAEGDSL
jgi:hypothetical protein